MLKSKIIHIQYKAKIMNSSRASKNANVAQGKSKGITKRTIIQVMLTKTGKVGEDEHVQGSVSQPYFHSVLGNSLSDFGYCLGYTFGVMVSKHIERKV
jgi:hypothetical protein